MKNLFHRWRQAWLYLMAYRTQSYADNASCQIPAKEGQSNCNLKTDILLVSHRHHLRLWCWKWTLESLSLHILMTDLTHDGHIKKNYFEHYGRHIEDLRHLLEDNQPDLILYPPPTSDTRSPSIHKS